MFSVLTAVVFVLLLTLRRRAPFVPFLLSAVLSVLSPAINGALTPLSYAIGRYDGRWPARFVAAVAGVVVVAQPWAGGEAGEQVSRWLGGAVLVLLPGAVGVYVRTRALLLAALRDRAEKAEAERELLARDAVLTERTRIAREMHDAVGHRVSLMVLQAGAIEMAAADEHRVQQLAGQVQTAGRQALDELRQMVGVLRAEDGDEDAPLGPQPGLADLPTLVAESRDAGMAVELTGPPAAHPSTPRPAGPRTGSCRRRSPTPASTPPARRCGCASSGGTTQLVVRVTNGPAPGPADGAPGGGYGLVGLAERVRTLGGRLTRRPTTGRRLRGRGGAAGVSDIRVLLVDDEELVRFGLRTVLESVGGFEVVGEAGDGAAGVAAARELRPDVVLIDIRMPVMDGLTATREILALPDPPQVAVLTTFHVDEYVYAALAAGAAGFLLKDTPPREIAAAVRAVADGTATLSPAVTATLIDSYVDRRAAPRRAAALQRVATLSEREQEVLRLLGTGESNAELARRLFVSEATVKTYVSRLLTKLDLTNRTQAAILAHEAGLLEG